MAASTTSTSSSTSVDQIKLAAEAAKTFTTEYYSALENNRSRLQTFYAPNAGIVWNGNPLSSGTPEFNSFVEKLPAVTRFEVQSFDAQPIFSSPAGGLGAGPGGVSVLVLVSGQVTVGGGSGGGSGMGFAGFANTQEGKGVGGKGAGGAGPGEQIRGFSDTFVLKPDGNEQGRYLIVTQGFRLVV